MAFPCSYGRDNPYTVSTYVEHFIGSDLKKKFLLCFRWRGYCDPYDDDNDYDYDTNDVYDDNDNDYNDYDVVM